MTTQPPPELVERVRAALEACWAVDDENGWRNMARYALDLATRAAIAMRYETDDTLLAVRRAVEGA